jgi:hypothetical protein
VRAILEHPALYRNLDAPDMVKSPIVYVAGALRTTGSHITHPYPVWLLNSMGQQPFRPPSVAGWDWGPAWMSSNAMRQRFSFGNYLIEYGKPRVRERGQSPLLPAAEVFARAYTAVGRPQISPTTRKALTHLAAVWFDDVDPDWREKDHWRADSLQRAVRHLLVTCPDSQLC